jgi:hypothetical protein
MKMKIDLKKLQNSINNDAKLIYEGLNSEEARELFKSVTDLYDEINDFENNAPPAAINALAPHLKHVHEMLEKMMQDPMSYVSETTHDSAESVKRIELKPVKV